MKYLRSSCKKGFTLIELLVVIGIIPFGYIFHQTYMSNNVNHPLNISQTVLEVSNQRSTTIISVWKFRCDLPTHTPNLFGIATNPKFAKVDSRTVNNPGNEYTVAQENQIAINHGIGCRNMFDDPNIFKVLCNSKQNKHACYGITTRTTNLLSGTFESTQYKFKSLMSDTRCLTSNMHGSPSPNDSIPLNP